VLPGKKYTPEDVLRILWDRKWILAIAFLICSAGAVVYAKRLPNEYRSETVIMLVPQRIPDSYVKTTVTGKIEDRLVTLREQILSRSRLERIVLDLDLYPELRRRVPMEDVIQRMRGDIDITLEVKESFRVSYIARDARTAQRVAERLAALFIEENLKDRENLAEETNQFLDSQLEDAKRRLIEHEKKLEDYRRRFAGQLPTQAPANLQAIQSAQSQLQALGESVDRDRDRRLLLERQLNDLQTPDPVMPIVAAPAVPGQEPPVPTESFAQQLETAQARLRALLLRDTPDHPDVKMMQRTIRDLQAKLDQEHAQAPKETEKPMTPAEAQRQKRIRDLTAQIADIDRDLKDKQDQDRQLRQTILGYQSKVDAVPTRESELVELTRDYTTLQSTYQSLLSKREESKIAANLERRNIGEQFRVLDQARVPENPFRPQRRLIALSGAGAGLIVGLAIVGFLEYRDTSFKNEDEVVRLLSVPVLAVVPVMISPLEKGRQKRRTLLVTLGGGVMLLCTVAALVLWRLRA
jgi:polysaccharide chain length determinant protein (PEP-CTERM system associated)